MNILFLNNSSLNFPSFFHIIFIKKKSNNIIETSDKNGPEIKKNGKNKIGNILRSTFFIKWR